MKVSLSWLGVLLIIFFIIYFILYGTHVYETFQNRKISEGFENSIENDLKITKCPAGSTSYIDNHGITLCCKERLQNGVCTVPPLCSLSETTRTAPTCSDWMEAYYEEKAADNCPSSMKKYFENEDGSFRGCTSGKRKKDGSGPLDIKDSFCRLYTSKADDESKPDSCSNHKLLDNAECFHGMGIASQKSIITDGTLPALIQCKIKGKTSFPNSCYVDSSYIRFFNSTTPRGESVEERIQKVKESSMGGVSFCSTFESELKGGSIPLSDPA